MLDKLSEKQLLQIWQEHVDNIRKYTAVTLGESPAQQKKRIARLEADDEAWFAYYYPKECSAPPADFQIASTKRVMNNPEWCEDREWSRELAKSMRTMMEVSKLILTRKKRYCLLISNSLENAERLLMPYRAHFTANERIIQDYGIQEMPGFWTSTEFKLRNGGAFRALGAGQSPRGTRNDEVRPDILLFDDIDTDEDCRNPEQIRKKWRWIEEAAIGTRSISCPTLIIFNGNVIAKDCCVVRAEKIADHVSRVNIRNAKGKSSWPQKNTEEMIDRVLKQKSYAAAQKEYFNNPLEEGAVFKDLAWKPARPLKDYTLLVCYTDPSFKETKKNDFKATVLVGKWRDEFHIIKCFLDQTTTAKMIDWHYHIMDMVGSVSCYYLMEQVFLQDIILSEFYAAGKKAGRTIPISGDQRQKTDKFTRIESLLEPLNRNGKLYMNEREEENPHMQRLVDQFKALAPGSRAHDDGPDAVEGAVWVLNTKLADYSGGVQTFARPTNPKRY